MKSCTGGGGTCVTANSGGIDEQQNKRRGWIGRTLGGTYAEREGIDGMRETHNTKTKRNQGGALK